jgi:hypothetical protein
MFQGGHRDLRGARPARSVSMDFVGSQPYFLTGMEDFSMAFFTFGPTGVEGIPVDLDGGILGNSVTLRFDAATNAQVVYFRGGFDEIIHGHHVLGDTWFTRTDVLAGVLQANNGGDNFLAMDLNPSQEPEIVFAESKRLRHAARSGGAWSFTYLDDVQGSVSAPAIIIAPDGTRHVAYVAGSREVRYAQGTGPTWSTQVLGPAMHAETDLALGPDGTLHLLYSSALNGGPPYELRHAWLPIGGTWQHETTWTSATGWLREAAIAVGNDGAVHIAFFARAEYAVFYQYRSPGGVWATPSLLDITFADSYTAVDAAIDPNGKLHIVYVARMMYHFWQ